MIKSGDVFSTSECADVNVTHFDGGGVWLTIDDWHFKAEGIKELRKFLKKLQKQLEGGASE